MYKLHNIHESLNSFVAHFKSEPKTKTTGRQWSAVYQRVTPKALDSYDIRQDQCADCYNFAFRDFSLSTKYISSTSAQRKNGVFGAL